MIRSLLCTVFVSAAAAVTACAQVAVPITFSNNTIGNTSTQTAAYGVTPSGGQTSQNLLTTINPGGSLPSYLGTTPATTNVTALDTYFGLAAGTLAGLGVQDGSGIRSQQVALLAGAVVRFDYVFLTNEDNTLPPSTPSQYHNDRAFFTAIDATTGTTTFSTIYTAGNLSDAQLNAGSGSLNFDFQGSGAGANGYSTFSFTAPAAGQYTFNFGVSDVDTNTVYSGLLIDNFNFVIVPEPGTNALLGLGAAALGAFAWRNRRRSVA